MMKTIKKLVLVVLMLTVVTGYATDKDLERPSKRITLFQFSNVKKGDQYTILDNQGASIHKEMITRNGTYAKRFDFTALNDGAYTLELEKDFQIVVTPFIIKSKRVMFLTNQEQIIFKPIVRFENDQLLISQLSLDKAPLELQLFYNGERIYEDELSGNQILTKIVKLSAQEKGDYYLMMSCGKQTFIKSFEL